MKKFLLGFCIIMSFFWGTFSVSASTWDSFIIRGTPTINTAGNNIQFITDTAGDKAGLGSNDINGATIGSITSLEITRVDDYSRFANGSGAYVAPYFNLWITDGTNYAVVANEPSNPAFQSLYVNGSYSLDFSDLSDKTAKVYENSDMTWLPNSGVGLTFSDLAAFTIKAPTAAELSTGWTGLGNGAPRVLGTNVAYGVNWVFGDSLSNYVSDTEGFVVTAANVAGGAPIPEPATMLLFGVGLLGIAGVGRRRKVQV